MTYAEFTAILSTATAEQVDMLDTAHWRYMRLIGIVDDGVSVELEADQGAYPQFIKKGRTGLPVFDDADCVTFMAAISGLSKEFCAAWRDKDFYELHGESVEEIEALQNNAM
ncbi:hypothetical protein ACFQDN_21735 [Pseudomonas asuensis]|uniref:Uncharacterized protein n=1 Tax=Pseudomonas asuensis TaxID=1825787 RepID=A0ABQ2H2E7_9PSED|nr:hypothetical protein [Pseudomonas asuensis]GGM25113.1 hypothetical protein GCM10009425_39930 [Pseudomonas asuensis]